MDLDGDHKVGIFAIGCVAIVLVLIISCVTYYSVEQNNMIERLVDKGISPAVMKCIDIMSMQSEHRICAMILTNNDINGEQAEKVLEELK